LSWQNLALAVSIPANFYYYVFVSL